MFSSYIRSTSLKTYPFSVEVSLTNLPKKLQTQNFGSYVIFYTICALLLTFHYSSCSRFDIEYEVYIKQQNKRSATCLSFSERVIKEREHTHRGLDTSESKRNTKRRIGQVLPLQPHPDHTCRPNDIQCILQYIALAQDVSVLMLGLQSQQALCQMQWGFTGLK